MHTKKVYKVKVKYLIVLLMGFLMFTLKNESQANSNNFADKARLYKVNKYGEKYGTDIYDNDSEGDPDLIAVYGEDGKFGYIKSSDLESNINTPEEALKFQEDRKAPRTLPVYDKDGENIISTFKLTN